MTEDERKNIINLADTIQGEINRMCVTNDKQEFIIMSECAYHNIFKLIHLINITRFKMTSDDIVQNRFNKKEDKNKCGQ